MLSDLMIGLIIGGYSVLLSSKQTKCGYAGSVWIDSGQILYVTE